MTELVGCFIDYETVAGLARDKEFIFPFAKTPTKYRTRPHDKGCLHGRVRFGTKHNGMVDVECACGARWYSVSVVDRGLSEHALAHIADQLAELGAKEESHGD